MNIELHAHAVRTDGGGQTMSRASEPPLEPPLTLHSTLTEPHSIQTTQ